MTVHPSKLHPQQALPKQAYTSADWFDTEMRHLFPCTWSFAGMVEDVREPGDYTCVSVGNVNLFVIRQADGKLAAFHNACRHRGTRLLEGRGNTKRSIVCFYHKWRYGLDGELLTVPQEKSAFPALDKSCHGLRPASVAVWRNLIFVHADAHAEPFADWLDAVPDKMTLHAPENLAEIADLTYRVRANWKIVVENFIDAYHFFYLHDVSLGDGDFHKQTWEPAGSHWTYYRPLKDGVDHGNEALPPLDGVPTDYGAGAYVLFPNLAIYARATYWLTFEILPQAADLTHVRLRIRANPVVLEAAAEAPADNGLLPDHIIRASGPFSDMRAAPADQHPLESNDVTLEDIYACEAVQEGLSSTGEIGPLATLEDSLVFFQNAVRQALGGHIPDHSA